MFKIGISGDLLNSKNKPCFGDAPLELLKVRKDIEISWMDKSIKEISSKMASQFDAILLNLPKANSETVSKKNRFKNLIISVSENIEKFQFNKSVANIYEYVNELNKSMEQKTITTKDLKNVIKDLCIIIQPFTPHLSEEIWELLGHKNFCASTKWPELEKNDIIEILDLPVQVNGKLKGLISAKKDDKKENLIKKAQTLSGVEKALNQKTVIKTIYIPGKILNIVIK